MGHSNSREKTENPDKMKNPKKLTVDGAKNGTSSTAGSASSTSSSELNAGEEDTALSLVMERFNFYRKEYKRLLKENGELWEENQKIKKSYEALKGDAKQLQDLMKLVTGEMGSALNMMEKAKEEGAEDMKPLE